eukprot:39301-Pyramimonas_sp.AAC.2
MGVEDSLSNHAYPTEESASPFLLNLMQDRPSSAESPSYAQIGYLTGPWSDAEVPLNKRVVPAICVHILQRVILTAQQAGLCTQSECVGEWAAPSCGPLLPLGAGWWSLPEDPPANRTVDGGVSGARGHHHAKQTKSSER